MTEIAWSHDHVLGKRVWKLENTNSEYYKELTYGLHAVDENGCVAIQDKRSYRGKHRFVGQARRRYFRKRTEVRLGDMQFQDNAFGFPCVVNVQADIRTYVDVSNVPFDAIGNDIGTVDAPFFRIKNPDWDRNDEQGQAIMDLSPVYSSSSMSTRIATRIIQPKGNNS